MKKRLVYPDCVLSDCLICSRTSGGGEVAGFRLSPGNSLRRLAFLSNMSWSRNRVQYLHVNRWILIKMRWCRGSFRSMDSDTMRVASLHLNIQWFILVPLSLNTWAAQALRYIRLHMNQPMEIFCAGRTIVCLFYPPLGRLIIAKQVVESSKHKVGIPIPGSVEVGVFVALDQMLYLGSQARITIHKVKWIRVQA